MSKQKSLFSNALWNILTVIITAVSGFILVPVIIKAIGSENFGIYSIILMIGGFAALQSLGLGEATLKYVSQYYAKNDIVGVNRVLGATLTVYSFSGIFISGLIVAFAPFIIGWFKISPENLEPAIVALRIAGFTFLLSIFSGALRTIPEATQRYDVLSKYTLVMMILRYSAMYIIAKLGGGIIGLTYLSLASAVFDILVYSIIAKRLIPGINFYPRFKQNGIREVFSYGVFSFINDLIQKAANYADQLILGMFFSSASVAHLTAPKDLITKAQGLTGAAGQALFPRFSSMEEGEEMQNLYITSLWILTIFSIIIFVPLSIIIPSFLAKWLTPEFAENSSTFATTYCLGIAFNGGTAAYFALLKGTGRIKLLTKFIMTIQLTAAGLTALFVYKFGLLGSGIRVLLFSLVGITICLYVGKKVFNRFPVKRVMLETAIIPIFLSLVIFYFGNRFIKSIEMLSWIKIVLAYGILLVGTLSIQLMANFIAYRNNGVGISLYKKFSFKIISFFVKNK